MTGPLSPRLQFQVDTVRRTLDGLVLNLGCNEDPAHLKEQFPDRVVNCDMQAHDTYMDRPNPVDLLFDVLDRPWPVNDDSAALVLLGDILEHFPAVEMVEVLTEARRVARRVAITVPEDRTIDPGAEERWRRGEYNLHTTVCTETLMRRVLAESGWAVTSFVTRDWGFMDWPRTLGHCILAERGEWHWVDHAARVG